MHNVLKLSGTLTGKPYKMLKRVTEDNDKIIINNHKIFSKQTIVTVS